MFVLSVWITYPLVTTVSAVCLGLAYGGYKMGFARGWCRALKLAHDAEIGHRTAEDDWEGGEFVFSVRSTYEGALRTRLYEGGIECLRCGHKTGQETEGIPIYRQCCICLSRIGLVKSAGRYTATGMGPFCAFHFHEVRRVLAGEQQGYTMDHRSEDEWDARGM